MNRGDLSLKLVSAEGARALDREASASWGLDPPALVEAAGRGCGRALTEAFPGLFSPPPRITVAAGSGNNGADALVMLRALILDGFAEAESSAAVINRRGREGDQDPRSRALCSLGALGVPVLEWGSRDARDALSGAGVIIDGIAGTGLRGPLRDAAGEMAGFVNDLKGKGRNPGPFRGPFLPPVVVSVDVPSGNGDFWEPGMPILGSDLVLAVEPVKACLYKPAARLFAGTILPVGGIFPPALIGRYAEAELIRWETVRGRIGSVSPGAYKYTRGTVEIRAGSPGSVGAARIAARGAQAAGAGLVRLLVDESIYPILAASSGGIMAAPAGSAGGERFPPDAALLGPGWGKTPDRTRVLEAALAREAEGIPLVLDADAIGLAASRVFHGGAILTPHAGEFAALTGIPGGTALAHPGLILKAARERRAVILFKSHVLIIACEDGRLGYLDGMAPVLAAGGSGDLLAGFCAALAARMGRAGLYDGYTCAAAAAALLIKSAEKADKFIDPLELADIGAALAGAAWLS